MSRSEKMKKKLVASVSDFARNPINFIIVLFLVGCAAVFLHKFPNEESITILMWAFACMAIGALVGFIFGVPRIKQKKAGNGDEGGEQGSGAEEETSYTQRVNTNLEEVSDWLTKIIIGIGLVEFDRLGDYLNGLAWRIDKSLSGDGSHESYAMALIIYFVILGFFFGYLATRLILASEFSKADRGALQQVHNRLTNMEERIRFHDEMDALVKQSDEYRLIARMFWETSRKGKAHGLSDSDHGADRDRFLERARLEYEQVRDKDRFNIPAAIGLAKYYAARQDRDLEKSIAILSEVIDHYKEPTTQPATLSRLYYNRACYRYLLSLKRDHTRQFSHAMKDLQAAVGMTPHWKPFALYDSDWKVLRELPDGDEKKTEFMEIVG